jgi:hypothetical protein
MKGITTTAAEKFGGKKKDEYEELIKEALDIQDKIAGLEEKIKPTSNLIKANSERLEQIKERFREHFGTAQNLSRMITPSGIAEMKVTNNYSVDVEKLPQLEKIFKDNLGSFVTDKISYDVTPEFKKLLADGDYKHAKKIREAVIIKQSCNVKFFPFSKN